MESVGRSETVISAKISDKKSKKTAEESTEKVVEKTGKTQKEQGAKKEKSAQPRKKSRLVRRIVIGVIVAGLVTTAVIFRQQIFDFLGINQRMPIAEMKRGINLGNALDSPRDEDWGLTIKNEYFDKIKEAGFDFVRLPVRFQDYIGADGKLEEPFMQLLDEYINHAIDKDLTVVLDWHHFEEIMDQPKQYKDELLSVWRQLSERYASYSNKLVFELLNEPKSNLHVGVWNDLIPEILEVVREKNPDRTVIVGSTNMYSIYDVKLLDLPKDDRLIVAFHYYSPERFTFQGDPNHEGYEELSGIEWGDEQERKELTERFKAIKELAEENGWAGVTLNEFGVAKTVPEDQRVEWVEAVRREAEKDGFSWAYWEFGTSFGIYDLNTDEWDQSMLDALMSE
jgi:endoglucanase